MSGTVAIFGEPQGTYIVTTDDPEGIIAAAKATGINVRWLGATTEEKTLDAYTDSTGASVSLADLRAAHEGFFPALMGADAALA